MRPIEISNDQFTFDFTDSASVRWVHASESSHQESGPHAMEYYIDDETIDRRFGTPWMRCWQTGLISPSLAIWLTAWQRENL